MLVLLWPASSDSRTCHRSSKVRDVDLIDAHVMPGILETACVSAGLNFDAMLAQEVTRVSNKTLGSE